MYSGLLELQPVIRMAIVSAEERFAELKVQAEDILGEYKRGLRCTAQRTDGHLCLLPAEEDEDEPTPWPLCFHHARQLARFIEGRSVSRSRMLDRRDARADSVVYFLQRADGAIKIGYTRTLSRRVGDLRRLHGPLVVLGVEQGALWEESRYHERFWEARLDGEWFRPTEEILAAAARCRYRPSFRHGSTRWLNSLFGDAA